MECKFGDIYGEEKNLQLFFDIQLFLYNNYNFRILDFKTFLSKNLLSEQIFSNGFVYWKPFKAEQFEFTRLILKIDRLR